MELGVRSSERPRIGLALGSGSARGWAHIGVLKALMEAGVEPDVVAGTSIGALVGAFYCRGHLDGAERWVRKLTRRDVLAFMDLGISGGGVLEGRRLMDLYRRALGDTAIEDLDKRFAAVATVLATGNEIWLQQGSLLEAVRASISLPGLFRPVAFGDHWLVDGGLVNPVPISVCRALGADVVIAVNLNGDLIGRHRVAQPSPAPEDPNWLGRLTQSLWGENDKRRPGPGFFDVLSSSINIMQDRITRSRMAGDPPDVLISPRLAHFELLDFARGEEAIEEGALAVERALPLIREVVGLAGGEVEEVVEDLELAPLGNPR